jgi:hypothetical protein
MPLPLDNSPERLREPHLLKFRLRQMFLVVTLASVLFALIAVTKGPWPWVIGLFAALVSAHVFGNFVGTQLRDTSSDVVRWRIANPDHGPDYPNMTPPEELDIANLPPETNLRSFSHLVVGLRWYLLGGLLVGTALAAMVLAMTVGRRLDWIGWGVGLVSGGVMGVWLAFLAVSFTTIARDALRQAHRE